MGSEHATIQNIFKVFLAQFEKIEKYSSGAYYLIAVV
jgi:hypothetical protein